MSKKNKQTTSKQLARCPFCGCEAKVVRIFSDQVYHGIVCMNASCIATDIEPSFTAEEGAIKAWNTRKPVDGVVEELSRYGSFSAEYNEKMTKDEIAETVLKQTKQCAIKILKEHLT